MSTELIETNEVVSPEGVCCFVSELAPQNDTFIVKLIEGSAARCFTCERSLVYRSDRADGRNGEIGGCAAALVEIILRERAHPEQGFRASIGILRLAKTYGRERLEAACRRAIEIGARSYSSVNSILKNNLDRRRPAMPADGPSIAHDNIRGPAYFN